MVASLAQLTRTAYAVRCSLRSALWSAILRQALPRATCHVLPMARYRMPQQQLEDCRCWDMSRAVTSCCSSPSVWTGLLLLLLLLLLPMLMPKRCVVMASREDRLRWRVLTRAMRLLWDGPGEDRVAAYSWWSWASTSLQGGAKIHMTRFWGSVRVRHGLEWRDRSGG